MQNFFTYDSQKVAVIVGSIIVEGYADTSFVSVQFDEPIFKIVHDVDGGVSRVRNASLSGTVTIILDQSSPSNSMFSALAVADYLTGYGVVSFLLKDFNGFTLITAPHCWVDEIPAVTYGRTSENRTWILHLDRILSNIGGVR